MTEIAALGLRVDGVGNIDSASRSLDKFSQSGNKAESSAAAFAKRLAGVVAASISVNQLLKTAEAYTTISNQLKLVTDSASAYAKAQEDVFKIAQNSRQSLSATAELYQRVAQNQKELSLSGQGVADIVSTISKTLVISGASAQASQAALIQLGQAFASGTLRGEELNSVMEQAPALSQAIAAGMGVTVGKLRELGQEGELTADAVVRALQKQAGAVDANFQRINKTVSGSLTTLGNSFTKIIGEFDQSSGLSASIANSLTKISDAISATDWTPYLNGITTAAKIYAAYLIAINATPAALAAASIATKAYQATLLAFSAQAALTTASLLTMNTALSVVFAAFAGFQIGSYLRKEFEIVEKAGIALAGGIHTTVIQIGGFFEQLIATAKYAASAIKGEIYDFLGIASDAGRITAEAYSATLSSIKSNTAAQVSEVNAIYADMFANVGKNAAETAKQADTISKVVEKTKELTKEQKKLQEAYQQTLEQYQREIALGTEATRVEELLYEVQHGRLKGITEAQSQVLQGLAAELDMRDKLKKAEEAGKEFDKVMVDIANDTSANPEISRLMETYNQRKEIIDEALAAEYLTRQMHDEAMILLDQTTAEARKKILENQQREEQQAAIQTMANIVSITQSQISQMQGLVEESSTVGRAFFVMTQTLAAANAIIQGFQSAMAIRVAYAQMAAMSGPAAPALLAAGEVHAGVAQAMGFATAGMIAAQTLGFKEGGYTGNVGVNDVVGVVHGREYVFDAASTARIGVDNLEAIRSGKSTGSTTNVSVQLYNDPSKAGTVERAQEGEQDVIRIFVADLMGDGQTSQALQSKFGLSPRGI